MTPSEPTVVPMSPVSITFADVCGTLRAIADDIEMGAPGAVLLLRAAELKDDLGFSLEALALAKMARGE